MVRFASTLLLGALSASAVLAADSTTCSPDSKCPSDKPCCSQYGECGTGAYCLGGCDPLSSNALDSCAPAPICQSKTYNFDNLDGIQSNTKYLGDASKADWVSSGQPLANDGSLILTMAPKTVGTLLANNHYMWYGKATARMKSSRGKGVVTAFILLSDVKDEIDYEFVGADLEHAQTNYYFQGITDYDNGANASTTDTFDDWHTYEIDWTPDQITWSIDGQVNRVKKKSETWNATANRYQFPQTPARVQLSLWPAGLSTNAPGTIAWAGGEIDWDSQDIKDHGYYYAMFDQVTLECYDPPTGANIQGNSSYIYTNDAGTNNTVEITDKPTVLSSFEATGTNMTAGASSSKSSSSASSSASGDDTVPGVKGGSGAASGDSGSSSSSSGSGSGTSSGSGSSTTGFSQGGSQNNGALSQNERVLKGSLFAVLVAVVVLVAM
ncbi:glycosyl hydrolases family 16 protein [Paecilomyces variotii No. 5]|uniref:Crh-like protein n=1 Tax=Byssochlamys spectabilis (strain No. 5 / NBRC 109023) TaxID=1356009 RepID=V5FAI0_BYSSN|nr:glycosyl hydrolases family 16 protein [Paecilomyces variotii No. 5]